VVKWVKSWGAFAPWGHPGKMDNLFNSMPKNVISLTISEKKINRKTLKIQLDRINYIPGIRNA